MSSYFNEFIVKIAAGCNLNCNYCYEYNLGDTTWRSKPPIMSQHVFSRLIMRINEHVEYHKLSQVFINFHGGEPLLAGVDKIQEFCEIAKRILPQRLELQIGIQTNATLIDKSICTKLKNLGISISISLDGGAIANDRHRLDKQGKSTYETVINNVRLIQEVIPGEPSGLLSVVDLRNDPIKVFNELADTGITHIDFLLPHFNHDSKPPYFNFSEGAYGEWLLSIFNNWIDGMHSNVRIRLFRHIITQFAGISSNFEVMNLGPVRLVTINTNGEIELVDTLKSTSSGIQVTGLNIFSHSFNDALKEDLIAQRFNSAAFLAPVCDSCKFRNQCGGGYITHRYSSVNGFANPSIYCNDLLVLLSGIEHKLKMSTARN